MKTHRVNPGTTVKLTKIASDDTEKYDAKDDGKTRAQKQTEDLLEKLRALQERLYASGSRSLLIVLQGMDTSGKDGTIKHGSRRCGRQRKGWLPYRRDGRGLDDFRLWLRRLAGLYRSALLQP